MDNEVEIIDSTNDDNAEENADSSTGESHDTAEDRAKYTEREKQYYARIKTLEAKLKEQPQETKKEETKSDDFGYDVKGYLKASGIKASEFDFVKKELKASGQDLDSLLENEYFQQKLEKHRALAKTADAIPTGKRSGGAPTDSVEYWMAKPIEEVPQEMRIKVVNARLAKETNKGVFYNS